MTAMSHPIVHCLLCMLLACALAACAPREVRHDPLDELLDQQPPLTPQPASPADFNAQLDQLRRLAQEIAELEAIGREDEALAKVERAQLLLLSFRGSPEQQAQLAEEYELLRMLLPENITPAEAIQLILETTEVSAQDLAAVEAARSIPNIQRYVKSLSPDARRRIARQLAAFTRSAKGRALFQRYLNRSAKYRAYIHQKLAEYGLPAELFCVALIESGFSENALSRAGAAGLWQFMPVTARSFGMRVDSWVDQRLDWITATDAACRYFRQSLAAFDGDMELAVASYNTGAGNVKKAIRRAGRTDFWRLRLHPETMDYVPKWIAAMIIYYDPVKYGFTIPPDAPPVYDELQITGSVELSRLAAAIGRPPKDLYDLNHALIRKAVPPDRPYVLRLPAGARERMLAGLENVLNTSSVVWTSHRLRPGETLADVADLYGVTIEQLADANQHLREHLPQSGEMIRVPVDPNNEKALREIRRHEEEQRLEASLESALRPEVTIKSPVRPSGPQTYTHLVRRRETLTSIAQRYDVDVSDLRQWNKGKIGADDMIKVGQKLTVRVAPGETATEPQTYIVQAGDTLGGIAKRHGMKTKDLAARNHIAVDSTLRPGQILLVDAAPGEAPAAPQTYIVQTGDTLSGIAKKHGLTVKDLAARNHIAVDSTLRPGQQLILDGAAVKKTTYTVRRGDTLSGIANKHGLTAKDLAKANGISVGATLRPGQVLKVPARSGSKPRETWLQYEIKSGDTLTSIARQHGCTVEDLETWNDLKRDETLSVGRKLKILRRR